MKKIQNLTARSIPFFQKMLYNTSEKNKIRGKAMKIAFLFPGQGAQSVGMGKDLYEAYEEIREVYEKASKITGIDIAELTFDSEEAELFQTKNTQIAILTMSIAILEILKKNGITPEYTAGLSLGEYSALYCGSAIDFENVIKIVKKRGEFMQNLSPAGEWAMAAILGLEDSKVEEICQTVTDGFVVPANYNCPGQVAISGDKKGVLTAMEKLKEAGAKRCLELKTAGPFHTVKLQKASDELRKELETIEIKNPAIKVIKNIDALPYSENEDKKDILAKHVIHPVRFSDSIQYMINNGVDTFIEIGPGKVLTGFVKKVDKDVTCLNINNIETLQNAIHQLKTM